MRRSLVAANWKLHGSFSLVDSLITSIDARAAGTASPDIVIAPPYPYLARASERLAAGNMFLAAQNVCEHDSGAYTGEVSASMVAELGCRYVITGHSERREYYAESNPIVAAKFKRIQAASLTPILCVGESLQQRQQGAMQQTIVSQVQAVLEVAGINSMNNAVLAYEPIWAIGTGKTASPQQAQEVHALIRAEIARQSESIAQDLPIIYGGSVKADNAAELFSQPDIDGGLIGGASLDAEQFNAIIMAACE